MKDDTPSSRSAGETLAAAQTLSMGAGSTLWTPPTVERMQALLPQYQFIQVLGRGGMGAVYKARQLSLDRLVAVKILPMDIASQSEANFVERFKNEARTMARLSHPSIVAVHEFGETDAGQLYFTMEFIDGTDVAKMIRDHGALPAQQTLSIAMRVCDALQCAHDHGVIHRDVKPANILIDTTGQVKVADFGLAKVNDPSQAGFTRTNMAIGTPDFIAPEAFSPGTAPDHRADLYAMGVMLYNMITGEIPRGVFLVPSAKVGADVRFDDIIVKAMQTNRERRHQSALEFRRELEAILTTPDVDVCYPPMDIGAA